MGTSSNASHDGTSHASRNRAAGSVRRPDTLAPAQDFTDLAYTMVRVLDEDGQETDVTLYRLVALGATDTAPKEEGVQK